MMKYSEGKEVTDFGDAGEKAGLAGLYLNQKADYVHHERIRIFDFPPMF
jgi:hypothetical protein